MRAEMEAASRTEPAPAPVLVPLPAFVLKTAGKFVVDGFSYDPLEVTKEGFVPVSLREAPSAVGRFAKVVSKDGQTHRGQLVRADGSRVELERSLGGGTVAYRVSAGRIDAILVDARN